jgi:uncharacterized protein YuzE
METVRRGHALFTYDAEVDALYVLLAEDSDMAIAKTLELAPNLHVDLDNEENVLGVEILYPRSRGIDLQPLKEQFSIELEIPFSFAA